MSTKVRKNMRLDQDKLDRAQQILGTKTETETMEAALDMVAFHKEVSEGLRRVYGMDLFDDDALKMFDIR